MLWDYNLYYFSIQIEMQSFKKKYVLLNKYFARNFKNVWIALHPIHSTSITNKILTILKRVFYRIHCKKYDAFIKESSSTYVTIARKNLLDLGFFPKTLVIVKFRVKKYRPRLNIIE